MKRVIIIGGGITGLAAAHRLLERSRESGKQVDVTVLEAASRVGGIVQTGERDGFPVPFYFRELHEVALSAWISVTMFMKT